MPLRRDLKLVDRCLQFNENDHRPTLSMFRTNHSLYHKFSPQTFEEYGPRNSIIVEVAGSHEVWRKIFAEFLARSNTRPNYLVESFSEA